MESKALNLIRTRYRDYVDSYRSYARMRGFTSELNSWAYHRRGFVESWAQPGFHRFWQVWNPGISYFVYHLFIRLGGRRRWIGPTIAAFAICGIAHTVLVVPFFRRWSFSVIAAFFLFGVLTVLSRYAAPYLRQERWPMPLNVALNVLLVAIGFDLGFRLDRLAGF